MRWKSFITLSSLPSASTVEKDVFSKKERIENPLEMKDEQVRGDPRVYSSFPSQSFSADGLIRQRVGASNPPPEVNPALPPSFVVSYCEAR